MTIEVEKKNGILEDFDIDKVYNAVRKSANRVLVDLKDEDLINIYEAVKKYIDEKNKEIVSVLDMHRIVEKALDDVNPDVAKSYKDYRNYKTDFVAMLDDVYKEAQKIMYIGDKENSNADSTLVSTKRSLIYGELNKELYKRFFLSIPELEAIKDGYIYIHDMNARRDCLNCCLLDVEKILSDGFEMGNIWYNEPKTIDTAFDVLGDIITSASSQQYGGLTVPEIDKVLHKYVIKSYNKYSKEYDEVNKATCESLNMEIDSLLQSERYKKKRDRYTMRKVQRDLEQGFQGLEYKLNTVGSSRGDYPFTSITFGLQDDTFGKMISEACLKVRKEGQGKKGYKKPVLFPKLIFLYDEELHGEGKESEDIFDLAIDCSSVAMYPDFLSLTGEGYVSDMYKKYGKAVSPMGCRAFLSPWYQEGGIEPLNNEDEPIFIGRANLGAISLNLPMILAKSKQENKNFYDVLDYYLELIRGIHIRTFNYLGEMKAKTNPLGFCEGGFYGGNLDPEEKIKSVIKSFTLSFGITALNELQQLYNQKSLVEDGNFALEVMSYINRKAQKFKEEDGLLYALYGTPAESLTMKQVQQFRKKYGIVENVSDKEYVSNSFHCHVSENISPIEKQDYEKRFWDLCNGGKIQYCKYPISYNKKAIKDLVRRAMDLGFYEGINLSLSYCEECGHEELNMDTCPKCGSRNLTKIDRMNGYLSYSRVKGDTRLNAGKMAEIKDRISM
ncbi:anaerobic ribonucleoside-triphosphate reductase [Peptostreptococcus faecalis]|uniref:anaerobic ribonucleoside-triphosphate reductase n=1 Tax=Peptostreptococcus faecalis TaxID=2045015 RepID=UPI002E8DFE1D|nr:anaerobic ribonucleoside-triphosphate reductase [Peptostreptococcus faecalis]